MNQDRLDKLRQLISAVNDSPTKQEFLTSFKAVYDFVKQLDARNSAEFDNFKVQFKQLANALKMDTEQEMSDMKAELDAMMKDCMAEMMVEHDAKMQKIDAKMAELRSGIDGMDGKDADEMKVMEMVLAKLPPQESLEPLDIVDKLESLKGDYRLDASAIKNLPETTSARFGGGLSRATADKLYAPIGTTGGGVDTANSPQANEFARFTDSDTIEGRTVAEVYSDLGITASAAELNLLDGITTLSGANTGDQTSIVGISGTKAQFDTAISDGNIMFDGDSITNATAANWKVFYSDGSGVITELSLGADGTFLKSNGAAVAPSFATPAGSGDVSKVGTPLNNQVGIWTGDGTLEGDANLTFSGSELVINNLTKNFEIGLDASYNATFGHAYSAGDNILQYQFKYYSAGGYGTKGIMLDDVGAGWKTVLTQLGNGSLYIVDSAGSPGSLTLGTRVNPGDSSTFIAQFGQWVISAGDFLLTNGELWATKTTEQMRLRYNASNYLSTTVSSTGSTTFDLVGTSPEFTFSYPVNVPDEAYGAGWNGSLEVPTKNALYDKIETLGGGSGITRTVVTTSGDLTLGNTASTDYTYYVGGLHALSMPAPNTNRYTIKNLHSAAITIDTAGAENIEGAANISLQPNDSVDIMSDGTNWYVH